MKIKKFASEDRGSADYGWLKANYSFSFARYHNPKRTHFGKLRVLNDDFIEGGAGFPTHPHDNMEIITIALKGALAHEDSSGGKGVIRPNEVQVMSAGTGVEHSEFNHLKNAETNILQIWIFPDEQNVQPRYDQQYFDEHQRVNQWQYLVSNEFPGAMRIHQNATISRAKLEKNEELEYELVQQGNGVYLFLIDGEIKINDEQIKKRDAVGIEQIDTFTVEAKDDSDVLCIEVPMN